MDRVSAGFEPHTPVSRLHIPDVPDFESRPETPSRSHSRTPTRKEHFTTHELDPLLAHLSPTSTLNALRTTDALSPDQEGQSKILAASIAEASTSERAFGIRAAIAGKKLREWCAEIQSWYWPKTFERPVKDSAVGNNGGSLTSALAVLAESQEDGETYGSLPAETVRQLDDRIETIKDELEALDVEELKNHVRGAHIAPQMESAHSGTTYKQQTNDARSLSYNRLEDFTVVISATILQALPFISRLNILLDVWYVRLSVLRQIPGFMRLLDSSDLTIGSAWSAIGKQAAPTSGPIPDLSRSAFATMRDVLQDRVSELGRRLDSILDALEGHEDRIPDHWIDKMEGIQEDYENWVVVAERKVDEDEWRAQRQEAARERLMDGKEPTEGLQFEEPPPEEPQPKETLPKETLPKENLSKETLPKEPQPKEPLPKEPLPEVPPPEVPLPEEPQPHSPKYQFPHPDDELQPSNQAFEKPQESSRAHSPLDLSIEKPSTPVIPATRSEVIVSEPSPAIQTKPNAVPLEVVPNTDRTLGSAPAQPTLPLKVHSDPLGPSRDYKAHDGLEYQNEKRQAETAAPNTLSRPAVSIEISTGNLVKAQPAIEPSPQAEIKPLQPRGPVVPQVLPENNYNSTMVLAADQDSSTDGEYSPTLVNEDNSDGNSHPSVVGLPHVPFPLVSYNIPPPGPETKGIIPTPRLVDPGTIDPSQPTLNRPSHLDLSSVGGLFSDEAQCVSGPPSATSSTLSDLSNAQIMDAAPLHFFKSPTEERFPIWSRGITADEAMSRRSSQITIASRRTLKHHPTTVEGNLPDTRSRSSSRSSISSESNKDRHVDRPDISEGTEGPNVIHSQLKSASTTSIEKLPRSELRNITIVRPPSQSATSSPTTSFGKDNSSPTEAEPSILEQVARNQEELDASKVAPSSPTSPCAPPPSLRMHKKRLSTVPDIPNSPFSHGADPVGALKLLSPIDFDGSLTLMPSPLMEDPPDDLSVETLDDDYFDSRATGLRTNADDQLTARITSILSHMPTRIKLASGPGLHTPEVQQRASSLQPRPARPSRSVTPSLTLAPAYAKTARPRPQHGDPNIKLYHLHQPGKEIPIKLYVRLVGEGGERVMVRVGGGWADLGEYLKEYANHHGRRSASNGKFEIKHVPRSTSSGSTLGTLTSGRTTPTSRTLTSGRSTPTSRPASPMIRPGSSLTNRKARRVSAVAASPFTPEMSLRQWEGTPGSTESRPGSFRSSSRISWTEDDAPLGLAGPKSKKVDMSPKNQAWVEGMMSQARQASTEKKKPGELAEIGKAGSTRRVFLKSKMDD